MNQSRPIPAAVRLAACVSLTAILFGFGLGGVFGAAEGSLKKRLQDSGAAALETVYQGDAAKMDGVVKKSFDYMIRAHLHGGAIGAAAAAAIALLVLMTPLGRLEQASALALAAGAVLYPVFWLAAGFMAPGLGGTGAAKEALRFLAVPGAGLALLGTLGTLASLIRAPR